MNKLIAIAIVIGLSISAAVRAESLSCNEGCAVERSQCVTTLGKDSTSNCGDGFRLCVQRCDPRRMNTAFLESNLGTAKLVPSKADAGARACGDNCAMSARLCVNGGNSSTACHSAQTACVARCASS